MEACKDCKFFLACEDAQGLCRRFPPQVAINQDGSFAVFPPMTNQGWCGEFAAKKGNEE